MRKINIRRFNKIDLPLVHRLIQYTIDNSYSEVYPNEAIEFFKDYHSKAHILNDAINGYTIVAEDDSKLIGTGTLIGANIRRVFICPSYQRRGVGKLIVQDLEMKASIEKLTVIDLDASLISRGFWESAGYLYQRDDYVPVKNDQKLVYYKMLKTLNIM